MTITRVLKVGGSELADPAFGPSLARVIARFDQASVIVHGGGVEIANMQAQLGLPVRKVEGLRVTDSASLVIAEMVLSGSTNKKLVRCLLAGGVDAVGISGVDGGLLRCRKKPALVDLGYVGEIVSVRTELVKSLLAQGLTVVLSPISLGQDDRAYNVNADEAASALALALEASELTFVSNVPGVLHDGIVMPELTTAASEQLIAQGIIKGGMIPKVRAATLAVSQGVAQTRIVNLDGLITGSGTTIRG